MVARLILAFLVVVFLFMLYAYKYRNPYKLIMIFGKKGSGKTTLLTKLTLRYLKKGIPVYSNVYIPGAYLFNPLDIGFKDIPPNSVIMIDEVGLIWDSRDFKSFKKEYRDYFKYQRQYRHTVYLLSQTFDIDKKLRDLTDQMYLIRCYFNVFSVARRINKSITIVHADSGTGESHLADDMQFDTLLLFWAGAVKVTFIPKYSIYFKSFNPPKLPPGEYALCPLPELPYSNRREKFTYDLRCMVSAVVRLCKCSVGRLKNRAQAVRKARKDSSES